MATVFSTVTSSSAATSTTISWPIRPGPPITAGSSATRAPLRNIRVLAASAMRMCDWLVSTTSSTAASSEAARLDGDKVPAGQLAVAGHAGVLDRAVEFGPDAQPSRPVLRHDRRLHRGKVRGPHVHEPAARGPRDTALAVPDPQPAGEHTAAQVKLLLVARAPPSRRGRARLRPPRRRSAGASSAR